jgi:hypothetical protein
MIHIGQSTRRGAFGFFRDLPAYYTSFFLGWLETGLLNGDWSHVGRML